MNYRPLRPALAAGVLLGVAGLLGQCVAVPQFDPVGTAAAVHTQGTDDGGLDAATASDSGVDGGNWWRASVAHPLRGTGFINGNLSSLSSSGATGGDAVFSFSGPRYVWLEGKGTIQSWEIGPLFGVAGIAAIRSDGLYCGGALWPFGPPPGATGAAIVGRDGSAERLVPDPLSSDCVDMNEAGSAIGPWNPHSYFRWPDGGFVLFDFYPDPNPWPDGGARFFPVTLRHLNERNEVVGSLLPGELFGYANPSGFYWSPDAGPVLLRNRQNRGANVAWDINNHGVIVGSAKDFSSRTVATLWQDPFDAGIYLPYPASIEFAEALGINDDGLIVGYGLDAFAESWGLVWWQGKVYFADDVVREQAPLHIDWLGFVNNQGRIAGTQRAIEYRSDGGIAIQGLPITIDVQQYPSP